MRVKNIRNTSTRKRIIEAFTNLLKEKDFEKVTIKNITDKASVNRATFYAHFEDKYQLFDEMIKNSAIDILKRYTKETYSWNEKQIECLFQAIYEYLLIVKIECPYSYQNLFPQLRTKMLDALNKHLTLCLGLKGYNQVNEFKVLLYSRILYDAAELLVIEKTHLSQMKILKEINTIIFE